MAPIKFFLLSLGCAKNTVDSDSMAQLLIQAGYREVRQAARADVILVNTCGFIRPAKDESLQALRRLAALKKPGQILLAVGCLIERIGAELLRAVPGVDGALGTRRWMDVVTVLDRLRTGGESPFVHLPTAETAGSGEGGVLRAAVRGASAYLKIADGCSRPCAFCTIPSIKGPFASRPFERILEEARILDASGVKELVLLAQDTTAYGRDLGLRDGLADLLEALAAAAPRIPWIRVLYAFPGSVSDRLITTMASLPQVLPYLDIPLQHAHPDVLRRMKRPADMDSVRRLLETMRARMPTLAVRSTFIVGYPGETDEEFGTLMDFLREMRFDRVGCFPYCHEEGTKSAELADDIAVTEKESRRARLMELQQEISLEKNRAWVGRSMDVLVEGRDKGIAVARSFRDAPEVDGVVLVQGDADLGAMMRVTITAALPYDLVGVPEQKGSGKSPGTTRRKGKSKSEE